MSIDDYRATPPPTRWQPSREVVLTSRVLDMLQAPHLHENELWLHLTDRAEGVLSGTLEDTRTGREVARVTVQVEVEAS